MGYAVLRVVLALILLAAAALKARQLATEPIFGSGLLESRWFLIAAVEFELLFALWLLSTLLPSPSGRGAGGEGILTWLLSVALFSIFACVSLYKALSGYASCGCFGNLQVNPWHTAMFDMVVLCALVYFRPAGAKGLPSPFGKGAGGEGAAARVSVLAQPSARLAIVLGLWFLFGVPSALAMSAFAPAALSDAGEIIGEGNIVVLEPEKWIGKRFPLLDYIDSGDKLKAGRWLVFLYEPDCAKCQAVIRSAAPIAYDVGVQRIALVAIRPFVADDNIPCAESLQLLRAQLSGVSEWFTETPVGVLIQDEVAVDVINASNLLRVAARKGTAAL
jgi:hypothetical protein